MLTNIEKYEKLSSYKVFHLNKQSISVTRENSERET